MPTGQAGKHMPRGPLNRRDFISCLGGAAAWPLAAHAQQPGKLRTIAYFGTSTPAAQSQWTAAFVQRLRELGWIEGRTVAVEYRWAQGRTERYDEIAAELVRLNVDVIVTTVPTVAALKHATSVIPIVFALGSDPVGGGLVGSLARPGGNVTGLSTQATDLASKRVELLREVVPQLGTARDLGQYRPSPNRAGDARGRGRGANVRTASHSIGNTPRGGHRPRPRVAQGSCASALCLYRSAHNDQPGEHQHLGTGCTAADDARLSGRRRGRRPDVLWTKFPGSVPTRR